MGESGYNSALSSMFSPKKPTQNVLRKAFVNHWYEKKLSMAKLKQIANEYLIAFMWRLVVTKKLISLMLSQKSRNLKFRSPQLDQSYRPPKFLACLYDPRSVYGGVKTTLKPQFENASNIYPLGRRRWYVASNYFDRLEQLGITHVHAYFTGDDHEITQWEDEHVPLDRMVIILVLPWVRKLIVTSPYEYVDDYLTDIVTVPVLRWRCHNRTVMGDRFIDNGVGHGDELIPEIDHKVRGSKKF